MPKKKVLFVCLGNICRSPAAEGIFRSKIKGTDLESKLEIDSCGTSAYHQGEMADPRMREHALKRNYKLESISRGFMNPDDFTFDYILTMDNKNYDNVIAMTSSDEDKKRVHKMVSFNLNESEFEVPDPYFGGEDGFERVMDILEDACDGLIEKILNDIDEA